MMTQAEPLAGAAMLSRNPPSEFGFRDAGLIEKAKALVPILRARAAEINRLRRIPADMIETIRAAGLFQLLRPRSAGGPEVPMDTVLEIAMELARGDGSVAWVWTVMITHDFLVAHFPAKARAEFWTDTTLSAASFTPAGKATPADGGVRLSGRWSFCSGVDNADWMLLQAMFGPPGAAHPDVRMLMVPIGDCRIVDDWDVVGLRGTGSNSVVVENRFVPEHRILKFEDLMAGKTPGSGAHDSPAYRTPLWAIFPFSIASVAPGIARGAFEAFVAEKKAANVLATLSPPKKNSLQMKVAEAGALIDAAELLFRRSLQETVARIMAEEPLSLELRARNRRDQAYAVSLSKRAIDLLMEAEGSRGLYEGNRTQRAFRDVHAASVHLAVGWEAVATNYGQIMLGGEPLDHVF